MRYRYEYITGEVNTVLASLSSEYGNWRIVNLNFFNISGDPNEYVKVVIELQYEYI